MKVSKLNPRLESTFWEHIAQDVPHYFFFISDMKHERAVTEVWLALDDENGIRGLMLIYRGRIVQLRGSIEAVRVLLDRLTLKEGEVTGEPEHRVLIMERFRVEASSELTLMALRRGEETPQVRHRVHKLSSAEAGYIAHLMRVGDPVWWGQVTVERIAERLNERLWLGVRADGRLVSAGGAMVDDWAGLITTVVTHPSYRGRGYATSIVSALVREILERSRLALIYVRSDNLPALRVYHKVGFKPCREYFMARVRG